MIKARDPRGGTRQYTYDAEGRLLRVDASVGASVEARYDAEGYAIEHLEDGRRVQLERGCFHRITARTASGVTTRYAYDTEARLVGIVNENGDRYSYVHDPAGHLAEESSFEGRTTRYVRDKLGRTIEATAATGAISTFEYDVLGRLTMTKNADGTFREFGYRIDGAMTSAKSEGGEIRIERDAIGRVVRETQGGIEMRSRYGGDGQRDLFETSAGARLAAVRNSLGEIASLSFGPESIHTDARTIAWQRDAGGIEMARHLPGGVHVAWERDSAGRPSARRTSSTRGEIDAQTYQWKQPGELGAVLDPVSGPRFFDHDDRGRVVRERRAGKVIERAMDTVGNVYRRSDRADRAYSKDGRILSDTGVRYTYDDAGRRVSRTSRDGAETRYVWNGHGLLSEIQLPDGKRVRFEYDAFARRTRKLTVRVENERETIENEVRYAWDRNVVVHELSSEQGMTTWYWEPDSFTPVARSKQDRYWTFASDHLGTPTELYDEVGKLAWKMQLDVFGVATIDEGDRSDVPWRWPGQYEDEESGLYYNRFRFYDPEAGGYLSPDPLGLEGGMQPYGYVLDPLIHVDPFGLETCAHRGTGDTRVDRLVDELESAVNHATRMVDNGFHGGTVWGRLYQYVFRGTPLEAMARGNAIQQIAEGIVRRGSTVRELEAAGFQVLFNRGSVTGTRGASGRLLRPDVQVVTPNGAVHIMDITTPLQSAGGKIWKYAGGPVRGLVDIITP
jgi:RHS repeat-associated protein